MSSADLFPSMGLQQMCGPELGAKNFKSPTATGSPCSISRAVKVRASRTMCLWGVRLRPSCGGEMLPAERVHYGAPLGSRSQQGSSWEPSSAGMSLNYFRFYHTIAMCLKTSKHFFPAFYLWNPKALMVPRRCFLLIRPLYAPNSQPGENRTSHSEEEIEYWIQLDANQKACEPPLSLFITL